MSNIYVVKLLPPDLAGEACKYQVYEYEIDRETKNYIWLKKVDSRIVLERICPIKSYKPHIFTYGRFSSRESALLKIEQLLKDEVIRKYHSYVRAERELNLFYRENNNEQSSICSRDVG